MTTIRFKLSTTGIKNEMLKGISAKESNITTIDLAALTPEERALLLKHSTITNDVLNVGLNAYVSGDRWEWFYKLDSPNIIDALKKIEAEQVSKKIAEEAANKMKNEERQKEEEERVKRINENREKILGNKGKAVQMCFSRYDKKAVMSYHDLDIETYDYIIKCREEEKQEQEQKRIAEKQAEEAAKEALRQWALQNGSELLKLRIEENMNWFSLANDEYLTSIAPKGFKYLDAPDESWEIKNADLLQIKALREIKKDHPKAKLMRYKYDLQTNEDDYYEDEEDRYEHKDVIVITLKSISGEEKIFEKELK